MTRSIDPNVMRVARAAARGAMRDGATAVVLMGSHARGDATEHSDIDLIAVLPAAPADASWHSIFRRSRWLVSIAWTTPRRERAAFRNPAKFSTYVPGWREAIILEDPRGVARRIQAAAHKWRWDDVADAADEWVAEHVTGLAEEVHKLVAATEQRRAHMAAVQRSLLALELAGLMALRRRILFGTENVLWDVVGDAMGARWRRAQARAFGAAGESLTVSCRAALELYAMAAAEAWELFDRQQRAVVAHACAIAGFDVRSGPAKASRMR